MKNKELLIGILEKSNHRTKTLRNQSTITMFVDFKKGYDVQINIPEELLIGRKMRELIKQTMTHTVSKVKFFEET